MRILTWAVTFRLAAVNCGEIPKFIKNGYLNHGKRKRKILVIAEEVETSNEGDCSSKKLKLSSLEFFLKKKDRYYQLPKLTHYQIFNLTT